MYVCQCLSLLVFDVWCESITVCRYQYRMSVFVGIGIG